MVQWRRATALAGASALVAGVMASVPMAAHADEATSGSIEAWGAYFTVEEDGTVTHPIQESYSEGGPWRASASGDAGGPTNTPVGAKNILAQRADGTLQALPGATASWADVASSPVAGKTVVSFDTNSPSHAAAVTTDGSVSKWGVDRANPNGTWTAAELGAAPVSVEVQGTFSNVLLADGRVSRIDTIGPSTVTNLEGEELDDVVQLAGNRALRSDGSVVVTGTSLGWETLIPANAANPVVAISDKLSATATGTVYKDAEIDDTFPASELNGRIVQIAQSAGAGAVRTTTDQVLAWGGDNPSEKAAFQPPADLQGKDILDLQGGYTFRVVVAGGGGGPGTPAAKIVPTVGVSAVAGTYGQVSTASVTLSSGATGNVSLTLDGAAIGTAALSGGAASFALPATVTAGSHALVASYAGSATHEAASKTGTLTIAKGAAKKPTFKASKVPTSKKKGKATITVTAPSGLAKATGKVRITLKKGGTTKTINTSLSGGKRSITLPKLKKGTWKVTVAYNGDANYNTGTSTSYKLKIKK